ncbi:MAG: hypothetical protein GTO14_03860, partial [Anaerolineales bacterium]|nr:hypothetical protein [Anaerolineales bacterium]
MAVIVQVAAFCFLAGPAAAQCPEDDPDCGIQPPQSQEIDVDKSSGDKGQGEAHKPGALTPVLASVPPPVFVEPAPFAEAEGFAKTPPDFDVLKIPLRRQDPADVSCGVQALGMALAGLEGVAPTSEAILSFLQHEGWMFEYGTSVEGLALAAQYFGYEGSVPFAGWSIEQLQKELVAGRPVVVALGANGPDQPGHFVTVIGVSTDGAWIAYNDPLLGRQVILVEEFTRLWGLQGDSGVAVARTPPPPASPDYASWMAIFAGLMASLALAPSVLRSRTRMGVGGAIEAQVDESTGSKTKPPYPAPPGYEWKPMQETVYAWR